MSDTKPQIQEAKQMPSRINYPPNLHLGISYVNCRKSKIKKIILKKPEGKNRGSNWNDIFKTKEC